MRRTMIIIYNEINGVGNISFDGWNEADHPRDDVGRFTHNSGSSFLGREYVGVKGREAISLLLRERQGWVRNAFYRKDIGDIALVWGNEYMGLQHIIRRRLETNQNLSELLNELTDIVERGSVYFNKNTKRMEITRKGKRVIVSPQLYGDEFNFVLTAFEIAKK